MRKFSGKYDVLLETAIQRFQQGGFLIGDLVKIKKNALSNEKLKGISEQMKQRIKEFQESDVNLRLCAVKSSHANTSLGYIGGPDAPTDYYVDIVQEISPSNWVNPTTLPMEVVEKLDHESWEPVPVPDSLKRMSPETTEFDKNGIAKGDIGADEYSRMSNDLNLPSKNIKLSNSKKWDDNKPGGGNTKGLEKLKDSVRVNDEKMLTETYMSILNEWGTVKDIGKNIGKNIGRGLGNLMSNQEAERANQAVIQQNYQKYHMPGPGDKVIKVSELTPDELKFAQNQLGVPQIIKDIVSAMKKLEEGGVKFRPDIYEMINSLDPSAKSNTSTAPVDASTDSTPPTTSIAPPTSAAPMAAPKN